MSLSSAAMPIRSMGGGGVLRKTPLFPEEITKLMELCVHIFFSRQVLPPNSWCCHGVSGVGRLSVTCIWRILRDRSWESAQKVTTYT